MTFSEKKTGQAFLYARFDFDNTRKSSTINKKKTYCKGMFYAVRILVILYLEENKT